MYIGKKFPILMELNSTWKNNILKSDKFEREILPLVYNLHKYGQSYIYIYIIWTTLLKFY